MKELNELSLMEKFADPALIDTLSQSDKVVASLLTAVMGMGITFLILMLLYGVIALMANSIKEKNPSNKTTSIASASATSVLKPQTAILGSGIGDAGLSDDTELVAVITAAIAAQSGQAANSFIIRRISRMAGRSTAWGEAGARDRIESRRF